MSEPITSVLPADIGEGKHLDPIRLEVAGVKVELMNLNDSRFPLDLIPAVIIVKSAERLSDEQSVQAIGMFTDYFRTQHPRVWAAIRKQDEPIRWITGLIQTWAEQSQLDPKA